MESMFENFDWHSALMTVLTLVAGSAGLAKFPFIQKLLVKLIDSWRKTPEPTPVQATAADGDGPEFGPAQQPSAETVAYLHSLQSAIKRAPKDFLFDMGLAGKTLYEARGDWDEKRDELTAKATP